MPREVPCDLFDQIGNWSEAVSQQADHSLQRPPPSPRTLRPRPVPRPKPSAKQSRYLAPTSGNPHKRKTPLDEEEGDGHSAAAGKKANKMSGNTGNQGDPVKEETGEKKRGRPLGSRNKTQPVLTPGENFVPPSPSKSSSKAKPGSPKRAKSRANARTDASIDLAYLRSCTPSVKLKTPLEAEKKGSMPPKTRSLYEKLDDVPVGCIPVELKAEYERETQPRFKSSFFLPPKQSPFPAEHLQSLKRTVDKIVKSTARNFRKTVHERQWGTTTVTPLINELEQWPELQHCVLMNVESCAIDPVEIRLTRPDGHFLEIETMNTRESTSDSPTTTSRMVDLSIGLDLDEDDEEIVDSAFNKMPDNDQSLNQSLSYIKDTPLLVDIELKKSWGDRDPRVQLAVWKAGGFEKMRYHNWDTSMPMPGITVSGSEWDCFLFFVRDSILIMMGPLSMGSTKTVNGTFEIAYKLYILMKWGKTDYEAWFKEHIRTWCQHKAAGTMPVEAGLTSLRV